MPDADLTEKIARVQAQHQRGANGARCACGWRPTVAQASLYHHQAEAVAAVVQDEVERLTRIVNGYDRTPAERRAADAQVEVERLRAGIESLSRHIDPEFDMGAPDVAWIHENLRALLDPPRPRITTTWGEPGGIGGPRRVTEVVRERVDAGSTHEQAVASVHDDLESGRAELTPDFRLKSTEGGA